MEIKHFLLNNFTQTVQTQNMMNKKKLVSNAIHNNMNSQAIKIHTNSLEALIFHPQKINTKKLVLAFQANRNGF